MATFTIVASTTDPLGPGEIAAGSTIQVSEGDVFIIDPSANATATFEAAGGIPANLDIVINDSNANAFSLTVLGDLTPSVTLADNVDASGIKLGAQVTDAVNFTAGNNAQFGEFVGSATGSDTINIGDGFTTANNWVTLGGDDSITVGSDASFVDIDTGTGNDTASFGDDLVLDKFKAGIGDDTIDVGSGATILSVDGEGGADTLNTQTVGLTQANIETVNVPAYISEVAYAGADAADSVEIRVDAGTDMSGYSLLVYDSSGLIMFTNTFGAPDATMAGSDVYVIDETDAGGLDLRDNRAVALVDDQGNVVQFITFEDNVITGSEGPANGLTAISIGISTNDSSLQSDDGGTSYYEQTAPNAGTVPCYAPGTMIDTPDGQRAVEDLKIGDLVTTLDHGPQPIRWVRNGDHPLKEADVEAKPVLIATGALGKGRPAQDLIVSPQHRMFVGGGGQLDGWFKTESFAPAKSLTAVQGIRHMKGKQTITWIHFACDRHEVVTANGCLSESLLLGPMVVNGLTILERHDPNVIYGTKSTPDAALNGPPARECLKVGRVQRHLAQCLREKEQRTAKEIKKWDVDLAMEQYETGHLRRAKTGCNQTFASREMSAVSNAALTKTKLAVLKESSEVVQQTDNARNSCERVIEILHGKLNYQRSAIILKRQSDGRPLIFSHCRGMLSDGEFSREISRLNRLIETRTNGVVHSVLDCANPITVGDVANYNGYISADDTMKSEVCFPLVVQGQCVGAFNVESDLKNAFDDDDAALMATISTQIALVINQARRQHATGITDHLERLSA